MNDKMITIAAQTVNNPSSVKREVHPAKDRVTEELLKRLCDETGVELQIDASEVSMVADYEDDTRYGERWSMQKAICCLCDDFPEMTVMELAFLIDVTFDKPNYGLARAKTDAQKFSRKEFLCQHESVTVKATDKVSD